MARKILFSPIGGNDPVSSSTERDGSMLHICRVYRPDKIYLYLSKEMVERHKEDNRYVYCIAKLGDLLDHKFDVTVIENPELEEVQDYDIYYKEFQEHISKIEMTMNPEDVLYVNIASGTPAMKSALLMMAVISEKNIRAVQVATPERSIQKHLGKDKDYDPEYYWEINRDNEGELVNRCTEPKCPNLVDVLKRNIIVRHLRAYNYSAARMLGEEIEKSISEEVRNLLEMAEARSQLDLNKAAKISQNCGYDLFPIKSGNQRYTFEYALILKLKVDRNELADFMRAISPLLTDLFEIILEKQCGIIVDQYCKFTRKGKKWNTKILTSTPKGEEILNILNMEFNKFNDVFVMASNLKPLLVYYLKDEKLKQIVSEMRDVEENIRNIAAHQMVSITKEEVSHLLGKGFTIEKIFGNLQRLIVESKIKADKVAWLSYDKMNEYIIDKING